MALGNFETPTSNEDNEDKKTSENKAEVDDSAEESIGKNQEKYKDPGDKISHHTSSLRDQLDPNTVEKLDNMKKRDQDNEDDSENLGEAA